MSIVRNSAQTLSDFVVRHASPGAKEWAEAMASEVAAIENDWHALGWAAGGMRVLFYSQPKPLVTLEELNDAAQGYADRRRRQVNDVWLARNLTSIAMLVAAATNLPKVFHESDRVGGALAVLGFLLMAVLFSLISREPSVPDRDDAPGLICFYREELRRSTRISSPIFWVAPAFLIVTLGTALTAHSWARALGLVWLIFLPLLFSGRLSARRRLAQIDALLGAESH